MYRFQPLAKLFLLGIWICLAAPAARGAHAIFQFQSADTTAQGFRSVSLYPLGTPFTNGNGSIITRDRVSGSTDENGQLIVSNLYGGIYRGELQGTFTITTNWYNFPVTNGLIDASRWTTNAPGMPGAFSYYTTSQSTNLFLERTGDLGNNTSFKGLFKLPDGATLAYVWTCTNANGAGAWQASAGGSGGSMTADSDGGSATTADSQ